MTNPLPFASIRALSEEVDATSSLFHHGFRMLAGYRYAAQDADPVSVCLAGGCEKLLKLTLGLHALDASQAWPDKPTMQNTWGHRITTLDSNVRCLIATNIQNSTAPGFIQELLDKVSQDPYIDQILATLERYAVNGRFYNLDELAKAPQLKPSPAQLWEDMQQAVLTDRPDLLAGLAAPQPDVWEPARKEINEIISSSLRGWWELVYRAWRTGIVGETAKQWAGQLDIGT